MMKKKKKRGNELCMLKNFFYSIFKTMKSLSALILLGISVFNFVKGCVNFNTNVKSHQ